MNIIIVGGSGLLGRILWEKFENNKHTVFGSYHTTPINTKQSFNLDIQNKDMVDRLIQKLQPEVIVHTAAMTRVDECETDKKKAFIINVEGTKHIAQSAQRNGTKMVYISTDYVFDGKKGRYAENEEVNPINYYGLTKLQGEQVVKQFCDDYLILRTSVIFGANKKNFATWILDSLKQKKEIKIVRDQFVSPTLNVDLGDQIVSLIEHNQQGVFHAAGGQRVNRYDFAVTLAAEFAYESDIIHSVSIDDMKWIAQRPKDSSLNISKISKFKKPYKLKEALNFFKEEVSRIP